MQVPKELDDILADVERRQEPLPSFYLQVELRRARQNLGQNLQKELELGAFAELVAWNLTTEAHEQEPWFLYFGPYGSAVREDGERVYWPDVRDSDQEVHEHWVQRMEEFTHPQLQARYADLSWELARVCGVSRQPRHAILAIDGYLKSVSERLATDFHDQIVSVSRALQLASQIKDRERTELAIVALLQLHDEAVKGQGWWWKTYDLLAESKAVKADRRLHLAASLEKLVVEYADATNRDTFDPFALNDVCERLVAYYTRTSRRSDAVRIQETLGRAFEYAAGLGNNMQASSMLQSAESAYIAAGLSADAKRARVSRAQAIERSRDEMKSFEITREITKEEMDSFIASIVTENPIDTLGKIANYFLLNAKSLEMQIKEGRNGGGASILDLIPISIMARDHQAALLGGVDEDLDGRVIHLAQQHMHICCPFLHVALQSAVEKHDLNPHWVTGFIANSGLFEDLSFLLDGVRAWFIDDHMKAIHVLSPQIEHALRSITKNLGEAYTKKHNTVMSREIAVGMGDILAKEAVKEALGADIMLYFKAIYSDPRGMNLRNMIAHGTLDIGMVSYATSNLIIHSLLVLALWDPLSKHRKGKDSEE